MCVFSAPKPPKDNSAEIARQREEERQQRIREGREKIDAAFSRYDDPYFEGVQRDYQNFYLPQVDDQYRRTREKLVLGQARTGNLNSGAGARKIGDLTESYQKQRASYANQALDLAHQYRQGILDTKDELYSQNRSAADPASIAVDAASRAGALATPPSASPIGAVFNDFLNSAALGVAAERKGFPGFQTGLFKPDPNNSQQIVR